MDQNRSLINDWKSAKSVEERTEIDIEIGQEMVEITKMLDAAVHPEDMPIVLAAVEQYSLIKRAQMSLAEKMMIKLLKQKHLLQFIKIRIPRIGQQEDEA